MDSFMRDLAAASSKAADNSSEPESKHSPAIQEMMSINKTEKKEQPRQSANASDGQQSETSMGPKQPTEEEQKQMLDFLMGLEAMRESNPAEYERTMVALTGAPPGQTGKEGQPGGDLDSLMSAVKGMRTGAGAGTAGAGQTNINMGTGEATPAGIEITPQPGFTLKTRRAGDESETGKIFVNICVHEKLAKPSLKKRLNEDGEEVEGTNIPMSVGAGRAGLDKSGVQCLIYDIIVNPEVVAEAVDDKTGKYRDFVCQLGMQCIEQKYRLQLDRRYKLPKLKYIGDAQSQMIQDRSKMPDIQEVSKDSPAAKKAAAARYKKAQEEAAAAAAEQLRKEKDLPYSAQWAFSEDASDAEKSEVGELACNGEYQEPMLKCGAGVTDIVFRAEIEAHELDLSKLDVRASPYRLFVKVPQFKPLSLYLPCTVRPASLTCSLRRREGFTGLIDMSVTLPVDHSDWGGTADVGSKTWLLSNALDSGDGNPYDVPSQAPKAAAAGDSGKADVDMLPEDRFHVRPPDDVDMYTGTPQPRDDGELQEDRFHKNDPTSQYYISQREAAIQEKWDKHEEEKKDREQNPDPNVEYIDMDDFKPGGKRGPQTKAAETIAEAQKAQQVEERDLVKAAGVVASMAAPEDTVGALGLSSDLWTELL